MLPKVMQVKNFGKRSRTKYTHLLDQDTTVSTGGFGGSAPVKAGGMGLEGGGCFLCGGPHLKKDCPQNNDYTGANGAHYSNHRQGGFNRMSGDNSDRSSWKDRDDRLRDEDGDRRDWGGFSKPPPHGPRSDRHASPVRDSKRRRLDHTA